MGILEPQTVAYETKQCRDALGLGEIPKPKFNTRTVLFIPLSTRFLIVVRRFLSASLHEFRFH